LGGSFIIAAICTDGIVLAEDTRAAIKQGEINDKIVVDTYFDTIQKSTYFKKSLLLVV